MTFPNSRLQGPIEPPAPPAENRQDVVPTSERNQDPERNEEQLAMENARPLTDEERKAADRDAPAGERVYAPASERVPRTVPDYRDVVENPDMQTPEREAVAQTAPSSSPHAEEPSFTRVARPSSPPVGSAPTMDSPGDEYHRDRWMSSTTGAMGMLPMGIGWVMFSACAGVGVWLFMRWRRERNKPINRFRREARQRANQLRDRMSDIEMPAPEQAARPAVGLGTALLSLAIVLWQQSQARSRSEQLHSRGEQLQDQARSRSREAMKRGKKAAQGVSDIDWQQRLMELKERWNPGRVELEKISIPKR